MCVWARMVALCLAKSDCRCWVCEEKYGQVSRYYNNAEKGTGMHGDLKARTCVVRCRLTCDLDTYEGDYACCWCRGLA